jgi:uncharacterized protein
MKLPEEVVSLFKIKEINDTIAYLATSSLTGNINLLPVPYTDVYLEEYILIPDLFAQKTKINLNENRYGVISVVLPDNHKKITIEGPGNIIQWGHPEKFRFHDVTAGEILKQWGKWAEKENILGDENPAKPEVYAQRGVIVIKAEKINYN